MSKFNFIITFSLCFALFLPLSAASDSECFDPSNVNSIGEAGSVCENMLIVDNDMLRGAASSHISGDESWSFKGLYKETYTFADSDFNIFTGQVTDMSDLFRDTNFNEDIGYWDTSNVVDLGGMFFDADFFNKSLSNWNTSSVMDMGSMFRDAESFNGDIGGWNVSSATNMSDMFAFANVFNQNISNWCVSQLDSKPRDFDLKSGFEGKNDLQPNWGAECSGSDDVIIEDLEWKKSVQVPYTIDWGNSVTFDFDEYVSGGDLNSIIISSTNPLFDVTFDEDGANSKFYLNTDNSVDGSHNLRLNISDGNSFAVSNEFIININEEEFIDFTNSTSVRESSLDYIFVDIVKSSHFEISNIRLFDDGGPVRNAQNSSFNFTDLNPGNYRVVVETIKNDGVYDFEDTFILYPPLSKNPEYNVSDYLWEDNVLPTRIYDFSQVFVGGVPGELNVSMMDSPMEYSLVQNNTDIFLVRDEDIHINHTGRFLATDGFSTAYSNSFWLNSSLDNRTIGDETDLNDDLDEDESRGTSLKFEGEINVPVGSYNVSTNMAINKLGFVNYGEDEKSIFVDFNRINPLSLELNSQKIYKAFDFEITSGLDDDISLESFWFSVEKDWLNSNDVKANDIKIFSESDFSLAKDVDLTSSNSTHYNYVSSGILGSFVLAAGPVVEIDVEESENESDDEDELNEEQFNDSNESMGGDDQSDQEEESSVLVYGFIIALVISLVIGAGVWHYYESLKLEKLDSLTNKNVNDEVSYIAKVSSLARKANSAAKLQRYSMAKGLVDEMKAEALKVPEDQSALRKMLFNKIKSVEKKLNL